VTSNRKHQRRGEGLIASRDLKVADVAAKLNASPSTVYREIHRGGMPAYRLGEPGGEGPFRVRPEDLDAYKANREVMPRQERRAAPLRMRPSPSHQKALDLLRKLGWREP
jgi:excisionase family DNA binding protein